MMLNTLTIDVEDYWSVFSRDWLGLNAEPSDAVVRNTEWFLEELALHKVKATFFILGEVARKFPSLIKKVAENGHEIGVHGFSHKQVFKLTKGEFRREIAETKKLLEDITSAEVDGHRAAAFSIMPETRWALEVLVQEGFQYDSSIFPIAGNRYGWSNFSREICRLELPGGATIIEAPLSTVTILGKSFPAAGGGYIRHFPYAITKQVVKHIQKKRPVIVYMHPYEIDTTSGPEDIEGVLAKAPKHVRRFHALQLRNRHTVGCKLNRLLQDFSFTTLRNVVAATPTLQKTSFPS